MSRLIVFYCLMIAGALSNYCQATSIQVAKSIHTHIYDATWHLELITPPAQVARSVHTRNHEASWEHQVVTGYTSNDFARWTTHIFKGNNDVFKINKS